MINSKKYLLQKRFLLFFFLFMATNIKADNEEELLKNENYLIENKIKTAGITNPRIINALRQIPRHLFLPAEVQALAYENIPLPFSKGYFDPDPLSNAKIANSLQLKETDSVLIVGVGSGYLPALLSRLAAEVIVTDLNQAFLKNAQKIYDRLNLTNIVLRQKDGLAGWDPFLLFEAIVINGNLNHIPESLIKLLKIEGKMIIPFAKGEKVQNLLLLIRKEKDYLLESLGEVIIPSLVTQLIDQR